MRKTIAQAAREAVAAYNRWQDQEGLFPHPEYDDLCDRMHDLELLLGMDKVTLRGDCGSKQP